MVADTAGGADGTQRVRVSGLRGPARAAGNAARARRIEARLQKDAEEPPLSVSIGIGLFPDDERNAPELLEVADRQLYQRKKVRKLGVPADASVSASGRG